MNRKRKAPYAGSQYTKKDRTTYSDLHRKCRGFFLTAQQFRVFSLLSAGIPRSSAEISTELKLCDPRGLIRDLRKQGVAVSDFWVTETYGRHFKRYFIRKEACNE